MILCIICLFTVYIFLASNDLHNDPMLLSHFTVKERRFGILFNISKLEKIESRREFKPSDSKYNVFQP